MSKPYQIENRRAMQRFEASLRENPEPIQLLLPSVEIALAMKQGVGELIRQAGLQLMQLVMERDVEQMLGPRYQPAEGRRGWRWGKEKGLVPHPTGRRCRWIDCGSGTWRAETFRWEVTCPSSMTRSGTPGCGRTVMRGLSTRQYGPVGAAIRRSLWPREVGGERALHRGQPAEVAGADRTAAGKPAVGAR